MKKKSLNRLVDFFIKDSDTLDRDALYLSRTIFWLCSLMFGLASFVFILQLFGYFQGENSLLLMLLSCILILGLKYTKKLTAISHFMLIGMTIFLVFNINETGHIFSYNHKWFGALLMFTFFSIPKLSIPYLLFSIAFQFYSLSITDDSLFGESPKEEYLYDNIAFMIISYLGLVFFKKLDVFQKERIDKQNDQLLIQKKELTDNNKLLQKRTDELTKSNQELERFAHIASHDLKTPLNNIISFSMLLEKELNASENEQAKEYFQFIKKGSYKMNELIKEVLEYSKISHTESDEEPVDLNKVINSIKLSISDFIKEKNSKVIVLNQLPLLKASKTKMHLLFKNLIENGLKYNHSIQAVVEIKSILNKDRVDIFIIDNGIGIESKYHDKVFEMFTRLHRETEFEGTGLGLALCKKIVQGMEGEVRLESQQGHGTSIQISLPKSIFIFSDDAPISNQRSSQA